MTYPSHSRSGGLVSATKPIDGCFEANYANVPLTYLPDTQNSIEQYVGQFYSNSGKSPHQYTSGYSALPSTNILSTSAIDTQTKTIHSYCVEDINNSKYNAKNTSNNQHAKTYVLNQNNTHTNNNNVPSNHTINSNMISNNHIKNSNNIIDNNNLNSSLVHRIVNAYTPHYTSQSPYISNNNDHFITNNEDYNNYNGTHFINDNYISPTPMCYQNNQYVPTSAPLQQNFFASQYAPVVQYPVHREGKLKTRKKREKKCDSKNVITEILPALGRWIASIPRTAVMSLCTVDKSRSSDMERGVHYKFDENIDRYDRNMDRYERNIDNERRREDTLLPLCVYEAGKDLINNIFGEDVYIILFGESRPAEQQIMKKKRKVLPPKIYHNCDCNQYNHAHINNHRHDFNAVDTVCLNCGDLLKSNALDVNDDRVERILTTELAKEKARAKYIYNTNNIYEYEEEDLSDPKLPLPEFHTTTNSKFFDSLSRRRRMQPSKPLEMSEEFGGDSFPTDENGKVSLPTFAA